MIEVKEHIPRSSTVRATLPRNGETVLVHHNKYLDSFALGAYEGKKRKREIENEDTIFDQGTEEGFLKKPTFFITRHITIQINQLDRKRIPINNYDTFR